VVVTGWDPGVVVVTAWDPAGVVDTAWDPGGVVDCAIPEPGGVEPSVVSVVDEASFAADDFGDEGMSEAGEDEDFVDSVS